MIPQDIYTHNEWDEAFRKRLFARWANLVNSVPKPTEIQVSLNLFDWYEDMMFHMGIGMIRIYEPGTKLNWNFRGIPIKPQETQ